MKNIVLALIFTLNLFASADRHAPIGVMLDHTHDKGELMVSIRQMIMNMNELSRKSNSSSIDDYFNNSDYMAAPESMKMYMTMIGAMYGLTGNITVSLMTGFISNEMTMIQRIGRSEVDSESSSLSDTNVNLIYKLQASKESRTLFSFGLSLPTGSIEEEDNSMLLGFPMQTGSGSFGLSSYFTHVEFFNAISLGSQIGLKSFLNDNDQDYRVGNQYQATLWTSYGFDENFSSSVRVNYINQDVFSFDSNRTMSAPVDFRSLNGYYTTLGVCINYLNTGRFKGHRLSVEIATQIDSNFSGYQLERNEVITVGWQKGI